MSRRQVLWLVATPVIQALSTVILVQGLRRVGGSSASSWADLIAIVTAFVLGPSLSFGAVAAFLRRHRGPARAALAGCAAAGGSFCSALVALRVTSAPFGLLVPVAAAAVCAAVLAR